MIALSLVMMILFTINIFAKESVPNATKETIIYVDSKSTSGNGSKDKPFTTIEQAKLQVAKIKKITSDDNKITVIIRGGNYTINDTINFENSDSGTEKNPIIYKGAEGEEVNFIGGYTLPQAKLMPITGRVMLNRLPQASKNKVMKMDLKAQGITEFGDMTRIGTWYKDLPSGSELFINNKAMTVAKYPNEGYMLTGVVTDSGSDDGVKFNVQPTEKRISRWRQATDAWVFGFWAWEWADENMKVDYIDTKKGLIKTTKKHAYRVLQDKRFNIYNLLEEIDMPGEYYIDKNEGVLYLYPPEDFIKAKIELSILDKPIVNFNNASYIKLEGITFKASRSSGVDIKGGSDIVIAKCQFYNLGKNAVNIRGGFRNGVISCNIYDTGKGGVYIDAGDRNTLTRGDCYATNNEIYSVDRITRTSSPGVWLYGVGNIVSHNRIHDQNHMAIYFSGNEHTIEYNEIYKVCQETADAGAIYGGRQVTGLGNVIRYNYLHDIRSTLALVHGIYLDDYQGWTHIYGNVFKNLAEPVFIHGGDYNIVEKNIFIDGNSARGILCGYTFLFGEGVNSSGQVPQVSDEARHLPIKSEIWKKKYPLLLSYLDGEPQFPKHTEIVNNYSYNSTPSHLELGAENYMTLKGNFEVKPKDVDKYDSGFVDYKNGDFRLQKDAEVFNKIKGFEAPPFEKMGLYIDEYRTELTKSYAKIELIYPKDGATNLQVNRFEAVWQNSKGVIDYTVTVATDSNFKNIIFKEKTTETKIKIPNLKYGGKKYYWKVVGTDYSKGGYKTIKSEKDFIFVSANKELAIKDELLAKLDISKRTNEVIKIGKEPGMTSQEYKDKFEKTIESALKIVQQENATQDAVDEASNELVKAMYQISANRVKETVNIKKFLDDKKGWKFSGDSSTFVEEGSILFAPKLGQSNIGGYIGAKIENHQMLTFDTIWNLTKWEGFGLRSKNADNVGWGGNYQYLIVVKADQIELQRYTEFGMEMIMKFKNTFTKNGVRQNVILGAVDIEEGVKVYMEIDGVEVINYIDKKYIKESGFFTVYSYSDGGLKLLPAKEKK
jgi:hypothetical protein